MPRSKLLWMALMTTLLTPAAFAGEPDVNLTFDKSYVIDKESFPTADPNKPFYFDMRVLDNSGNAKKRYPFTVSKGTKFDVGFDSTLPPDDQSGMSRSLHLQLKPADDVNVQDKIIFSPIPHKSELHLPLLNVAKDYYFEFNIKLDQSYETQNRWALHMQAWQCCGDRPPFGIYVAASPDKHSPVLLLFEARDDKLENATDAHENIVYRMVVDRSRWYNIRLKLRPSVDGSAQPGVIAGWIDGNNEFSYTGNWGYDPAQHMHNGHLVDNAIGLDLGIYRRRQVTNQSVYFSNIRFWSGTP